MAFKNMSKRGFDTYNKIVSIVNAEHGEGTLQFAKDEKDINVLRMAADYTQSVDLIYGVLIGKIALQIFKQKFFDNPLAIFKGDNIPLGDTIEKVHINLTQGTNYDPTGANLHSKYVQDVDTEYFKVDIRKEYAISISDAQMINGLKSFSALAEITQELIGKMYESASFEEFERVKNALGDFTPSLTQIVEIDEVIDEQTAKDFVKKVKKSLGRMQYPTTLYNSSGRTQSTKPQNCALIVNSDIDAELTVELMAYAFNKEELDILVNRIVKVDNFGSTNTDTRAILMDEDFLVIHDQLMEVKTVENGRGLFMNYFLHVWQVLGLSQFENAVYFNVVEEV